MAIDGVCIECKKIVMPWQMPSAVCTPCKSKIKDYLFKTYYRGPGTWRMEDKSTSAPDAPEPLYVKYLEDPSAVVDHGGHSPCACGSDKLKLSTHSAWCPKSVMG